MKPKKKTESGGASWMDTYGDMMTLLLCFFVLLYSISSVDQVKWENLVRSLNPDAEEPSQIVTVDTPNEGDEDVPGSNQTEADIEFQEIYDNLLELKESSPGFEDVQIATGEGYQFITFNDSVFFEPDSAVLLPEGQQMLDLFGAAIAPAQDSIKEMQILGHTTQASIHAPIDIEKDRVLSANRSAVVASYLQQRGVVSGDKLISLGYGQFRPIASFETPEESARNRRVEILITKSGSIEQSLDNYYSQVYGLESEEAAPADGTATTETTTGEADTPTDTNADTAPTEDGVEDGVEDGEGADTAPDATEDTP